MRISWSCHWFKVYGLGFAVEMPFGGVSEDLKQEWTNIPFRLNIGFFLLRVNLEYEFKSHNPRKCFFCDGSLQDSTTDFTAVLPDGDSITVKNVMSHRCDKCGDEVFPPLSHHRIDNEIAAYKISHFGRASAGSVSSNGPDRLHPGNSGRLSRQG